MIEMPPEHIVDGDISRLEAFIPSFGTAAAVRGEGGSSSISGERDCKSDHEDDRGQGILVAVTVPSLSLFNNCEEDCDNRASASNKALSRDEIQLQTAECMSRPIRFDIMEEKNMNDTAEEASPAHLKQQTLDTDTNALALQSAAARMLEGCIESMDQLVDARLGAYSKILRQHYVGKKNDHAKTDHDEDGSNNSKPTHHNNVVDFKLRTLLGLGTNISFDSISLKIRTKVDSESPKPMMKPQLLQDRNQEEKEQDVNQKTSTIEKHIVLEVVMNGLSIGGDKQQQEEEEHCEGKASVGTNYKYGNSDETKYKRLQQQQHVIRLEVPGIVLVQREDDQTEEAPAETETKKGNTTGKLDTDSSF